MRAISIYQYKNFREGTVLCILLMFVFSACNAGGNEMYPHTNGKGTPVHASGCTALPTKAAGQDNAIVANIPLPGNPFKAVATSDGQWIFVSLFSPNAASNGIAVLHETGAQICLQRVIPLIGDPLGLALTHDNSILLVANNINVTFVDVAQAESKDLKAISGLVLEQENPLAIEVELSQDERDAFVANENDGTVGVIDMQHIRAHDFSARALVGLIPVNKGPRGMDSGAVGLAVSPDNHYLYVVSRIDTGDSATGGYPCYGYPPGTLSMIAIDRAAQNPAHAVLAHVFAGCGPVRVILSPAGDTAWVTTQEDNVVKAFNTARMLSDPAHAQLSSTHVGEAPTGELLVNNGKVLVVTDSNRFLHPRLPQTLTVLDTKQALQGKAAILATIKVGAFPRELTLEAGRQRLLLTNYNSDTLSIIDIAKLPA